MPRKTPVEIRVVDFARKVLPTAKVTMVPLEQKSEKVVELKFDERRKKYGISNVAAGLYLVKAEAPDLEPQEREVRVEPTGLKDVFVLGMKGMPFYYKRTVKVPFEPEKDLLAVAVKPYLSEKQDKTLNDYASELGLSAEKISDDLRANHVRLFRFKKNLSNADKQEIQEKMERNPLVRRAGPIVYRDDRGLAFLTNELVVRFNQKFTREETRKTASDLKLEVVREIPHIQNGFLFRVKGVATYGILDVCATLVRRGMVDYAEPNLFVTAIRNYTPNDPRFSQQPHHALIQSEGAWDLTMGDDGILIAVMDDGCDFDHEDLTNPAGSVWTKVANPFNFTTYTANPSNSSHGTRSCGIATAVADNSLGVAGGAPNCQLMPLEWVNGTISEWSDAYIWIAGGDPKRPAPFPTKLAKGADVISNSIGVVDDPMSGVMKDTWDYIMCYGRNGRGCVVVFAAGNQNIDLSTDPYSQWADYEKTLAVASCTISPPDAVERKVSTSSFGDSIDLCAPGGGPGGGTETRTMSTNNSNGYTTHGQTSCACPQVAGVAALMLSANPDLNWVELRQILRDTATHIDTANISADGIWRDVNGVASNAAGYLGPYHSRFYGYGRVNAQAAVQAAVDLVGIDPLTHIDTWIMENLADVGNVPCPPPYSPDVWVRNLPPAADDPAHVTEHQPPIRGQDNWVYINVRNRGADDSYDVYARVMITRWAGTQYVYPDDFLPTVMPSTIPAVMAPGTYLIGEVHVPSVASGGFVTVNTRWPKELIPPETVTVDGVTYSWADSCLLVEISPHDGPTPTGVNTWDNNNLCQRNITILDAPVGADAFAFAFVVGHLLNKADVLNLRIERQNLPAGVEIYIDYVNKEAAAEVQRFLKKISVEKRYLETCDLTILSEVRGTIACPESKAVPIVIPPKTHFRFPHCMLAEKPLEYGLMLKQEIALTAFSLPTVRTAWAPVLRRDEPYQLVALRGKGLKKLKKGEYQINIYQEDLAGRTQGGINLLVRKT